jgi:hypothetical protein
MKKLLRSTSFLLFCFIAIKSESQISPIWSKDINSLPDSAAVIPVRTANDANSNVYVLCTYMKGAGPQTKFKIYLSRHDSLGTPYYNLKYDNGGVGSPRGFDMAVDAAGNCYIAGGWMTTPSFKPLLMKISPAGNVIWQRDSTASFNTGNYSRMVLRNDKIFLLGTSGLAQFDTSGIELWSNDSIATTMVVDHQGQVVYSTSGSPDNIFRCDSNGVNNFSDSSIYAQRLAVDNNNNFFLLTYSPAYSLVKYDNAGNFMWRHDSFPAPPPFMDMGMEVVCNSVNDVMAVGLNDTIYKFDPAGNVIWIKPMSGLDSYMITAQITFNDQLAVAGTIAGANGNDMYIFWFDLNGNPNWGGSYDGNTNLTEYSQDMSIDNSGIYAIENNDDNTSVVRFANPLTTTVADYSKICIDSIWYDNGNHNFYNLRVYNGNVADLINPSIQMVSIFGDTSGNPANNVSVPVHSGNSWQIYHDAIVDPFIVSFLNYTFLFYEHNGDTMQIITWCSATGVNEMDKNNFVLFPNPANDVLYLKNLATPVDCQMEIYSELGIRVLSRKLQASETNTVDVSSLSKGIYYLRLIEGRTARNARFVKQ